MSTIALHSTLNISETARERRFKGPPIGNSIWGIKCSNVKLVTPMRSERNKISKTVVRPSVPLCLSVTFVKCERDNVCRAETVTPVTWREFFYAWTRVTWIASLFNEQFARYLVKVVCIVMDVTILAISRKLRIKSVNRSEMSLPTNHTGYQLSLRW